MRASHVFYGPMFCANSSRAARCVAAGIAMWTAFVLQPGIARGQSRRALHELGRLDPPAYAPPLVRQGEVWPLFDSAMQVYSRKQYPQCADLLRRAVAVEPEDAAANSFLAAALMMTDEVGEAEDRAGVALAAGQTPYGDGLDSSWRRRRSGWLNWTWRSASWRFSPPVQIILHSKRLVFFHASAR